MKTTAKTMMLLMAMILTLNACTKKENEGSVELKVTDAPFPYKFVSEAKVKITKVELKNTDNEYVTVFEGNSDINLVNFRNGVTANLSVQSIPTGTYNGIKITIDGAEIVLSNGADFTVDPTANMNIETSLNPELVINEKETQEVLLDIDLSDSFSFRGVIGGWITAVSQITGISSFEPDIRVANLEATGSISGIVKDANGEAMENIEVYVKYDYNGDGVPDKVSTVTESDGSFKIIGLPAGDFTVYAESNNSGQAQVVVDVEVNHNASVNLTVHN